MRVLQENYSQSAYSSIKADYSTASSTNKENYNQLDQHGKMLQSHNKILLDKDFNLTIVPSIKESSTQDIVEAMGKVQDYQNQCMKDLKLKEAQETKEKMIKLKKELFTRQKKLLEGKYQQKAEKTKENQAKDMSDFNEFWNKKIVDFELEASNIEREMLARHKDEHIKAADELKLVVPMKKKASPQHLSYKRTLEALLKRKDFIDAERIKAICDTLEREEIMKAFQEKEKKVKFLLSQLDQRHKNEINVLRKRIITGREGLLKAKAIELEKLLLKFQNIRQHHDLDHNHELYKFESNHKSLQAEDNGRSSSKLNVRSTSRSNSRSGSRIQDSSKSHTLSMSMLSPLNLTLDRQSAFVSPVASTSSHKRSQTNIVKDFNMIEISSLLESQSNFKTKRSSSTVRQAKQ